MSFSIGGLVSVNKSISSERIALALLNFWLIKGHLATICDPAQHPRNLQPETLWRSRIKHKGNIRVHLKVKILVFEILTEIITQVGEGQTSGYNFAVSGSTSLQLPKQAWKLIKWYTYTYISLCFISLLYTVIESCKTLIRGTLNKLISKTIDVTESESHISTS